MSEIIIKNVKGEKLFSDRLNYLISQAKDGDQFIFESGEYYLDRQINVINKNNLTFNCTADVLFKVKFDRTNGGRVPTTSINGFYFEGCNNITFKGGVIQASCPPSVKGKLICVNKEEDYVEVEVYPESPLPDDVKFIGGMTFDSERMPTHGAMGTYKRKDPRYDTYKDKRIIVANELVTTNAPSPTLMTERLSENVFRFRGIMNMHVHEVGLDVALYHSYYGVSAFIFRNTSDVVIDGVRINNFGGMGYLVLTRCYNYEFKNLIFDNPDKEHSWMSTQSDAIHTLGLGGKLLLENIYFDATCDDCLNVHSQILTCSEITGDKYKLIYDKKQGIVSKTWAKQGDKLYVYDNQSLTIKGEVIVESFVDGYATFKKGGYDILVGDMLTNCEYMPDVTIKHCVIHKCVGQYKIKSCKSAIVTDCRFYNEGRGVNVSEFLPTLEGGPAKNVVIENNEFYYSKRQPPIFVGYIKDFSEYNDYEREDVPIIENVTIKNNKFIEMTCDEIIRCLATDGLVIKDNQFIDCKSDKITIKSCKNVTLN